MSNFNFEDWFKSLSLSEHIHNRFEGALQDLVANETNGSHSYRYNTLHN